MRRREFVKCISGALAAWPLGARAQQSEQMRRIRVLINRSAEDPEGQPQLAAFRQVLQQLGWTEGRNVRIDYRWGGANIADTDKYAAELVALAPDVILAAGSPSVAALQRVTRTLPTITPGGRARRHDQTAIRRVGESCDGAFDLARVASIDRSQFNAEGLRHRLDGTEFRDPGTIIGVAKHSRSRNLRRNLFKEF